MKSLSWIDIFIIYQNNQGKNNWKEKMEGRKDEKGSMFFDSILCARPSDTSFLHNLLISYNSPMKSIFIPYQL